MPFDSYLFLLVFLPAFLFFRRAAAPMGADWIGRILVLGSLLWCAMQDIRALILLPCMVCLCYGFGLCLAAPGERERGVRRRSLLLAGCLISFLPLVVIRAAGWAALEGLSGFSCTAGVPGPGAAPLACLAFQALLQTGWLVGIYRRQIEPEGLGRHMLFSLFLPTVWAGPIVRYEQMGIQFDALETVSDQDTFDGISYLVLGLAKKVLLADGLVPVTAPVFSAALNGTPFSCTEAWIAVLCTSLQFYFDFSGLTDISIGLARLCGVRLPVNFRSPCRATGFIDFWHRWHITLSSWLRDFVFLPLGGVWCGGIRQYASLFAAVVLAGLWYGSGWLFLIWGALHGLFICINYAFRSLIRGTVSEDLLALPPAKIVCGGCTFVLVSLCWALLRSESPDAALVLFHTLLGLSPSTPLSLDLFARTGTYIPVLAGIVTAFFLPASQECIDGRRDGTHAWPSRLPGRVRAILLAVLGIVVLCMAGNPLPFLF